MSKKIITSTDVLWYVHELIMPVRYSISNCELYFDGVTPLNLRGNTIVLRHTAGRSGDVQEGVVTVLIYSQPILSQMDGRRMPDTSLVSKIERKAQDWVESLPTGEYLFWSDDTVQTDYDPEAGLYFTSIRLKYRHY